MMIVNSIFTLFQKSYPNELLLEIKIFGIILDKGFYFICKIVKNFPLRTKLLQYPKRKLDL